MVAPNSDTDYENDPTAMPNEKEAPSPDYGEAPPPRWNDGLWLPILFCVLVGFIVMAGIDLNDYVQTKCYKGRHKSGVFELLDFHTLMVLLCSSLLAIVLSCMYYLVAFLATRQFICLTMVFQVLATVAMGTYYYANQRWTEGTFAALWLVVTLPIYLIVRGKIDQATDILQKTIKVAQESPAVFVFSGFGAFFPAGFSLLSGMMIVANYGKSQSAECSLKHALRPTAEFYACLVYVSFASYLLIEVIKAIIRTTICSVFGTWYYTPAKRPGATGRAFASTVSLSLGSVCFGCFILAFGNVVALIAGAAAQTISSSAVDASVIMVLWLVTHCVTVFDWLIGHFNNYVYAHVSLYNMSYLEGARATVKLFQHEGWGAISNDCLAGGVLTFGSWTIGAATGLLSFLYLRYMAPLPVQGIPFLVTYISILATEIASVFTIPISAGVQTLFVSTYLHPDVLRDLHSHEQ